jgi:hypothetical protein
LDLLLQLGLTPEQRNLPVLHILSCLASLPKLFTRMLTWTLIRDYARLLTRVATRNLTRVAYPSLLPRISPERLPELYPDTYPIRLTQPYPKSYPAELPYPDHFLTRLLPTRSYPTTLPDFLARPDNTSLPYPKTSSSASHLNIGLFRSILHQDCSDNPKPTRITLKQPG